MRSAAHLSKIWARCPSCRAWFSCPRWFDRGAPDPACPTCGIEPDAIENRALLAPVASRD